MTDQSELFYSWLRTHGVPALLILLVAWIAYQALQVGTTRLERTIELKGSGAPLERRKRAFTLVSIFRSVGVIVIIIIGGLMLLAQFNVDITPLIAGAGVIGLAIGLGAQTLVRDLIGGLFIIIEDQFHVGDTVRVGNVAGSVERITLRATYLRDQDGTLHFVPNGEIRIVSNRTSGWSRSIVDVSVDNEQNIGQVIAVLESVAREANDDPSLKPKLLEPIAVTGVEGLENNAVRLRLMSTTVAGQQEAISRALRQRIKEKFDAEGISMPRQEIFMRDAKSEK